MKNQKPDLESAIETLKKRKFNDEKDHHNEEENISLLENHPIKFYSAIYESAKFAIPFSLSRLATASQNVGNGIVINLKFPYATTVSPIMFMLQQGLIGPARGALSSVNAVIGNLNGQEKFELIGPAVNQGLILATFIGIPTTFLFFTSRYWLAWFGMRQILAEQAGEYLRALSYGIIPTYLTVVDQNFLLSIKRTYSPIVLNTFLVGASMGIGYLLAIFCFGLPGLGYGMTSASILTFIIDRLYLYFNKVDGVADRHKYNLFTTNLNSGTPFKELIGLSFPTALQATSEWLPTMLIAIITASSANAQQMLDAEQPSMQMLVILNQILLGLGTAATVSVANALGRARAFYEKEQYSKEFVWKKNARIYGYANIIVTALIMVPFLIFFSIYPNPIVKLFSNNKQVENTAKNMLRVVGASFLIDGIRNTTTGAILGKKIRADNFFTSLTNLIITAGIATALGYFMQGPVGPLSFFIFRMLGILVTTLLLLWRWNHTTKPIETTDITTVAANYTCPKSSESYYISSSSSVSHDKLPSMAALTTSGLLIFTRHTEAAENFLLEEGDTFIFNNKPERL